MAKSETRFGTFEELMAGVEPELVAIATKLRDTVFAIHPEAVEVVRLGDRATTLGVGPKKMSEGYCYIMPHKKWINLGFYKGAMLADPENLLEGTGKALRHVKVRDMALANSQAIRSLIAAALAERKAALGRD